MSDEYMTFKDLSERGSTHEDFLEFVDIGSMVEEWLGDLMTETDAHQADSSPLIHKHGDLDGFRMRLFLAIACEVYIDREEYFRVLVGLASRDCENNDQCKTCLPCRAREVLP